MRFNRGHLTLGIFAVLSFGIALVLYLNEKQEWGEDKWLSEIYSECTADCKEIIREVEKNREQAPENWNIKSYPECLPDCPELLTAALKRIKSGSNVAFYKRGRDQEIPTQLAFDDYSCWDLTRLEQPWQVNRVSLKGFSLRAETESLGLKRYPSNSDNQKYVDLYVSTTKGFDNPWAYTQPLPWYFSPRGKELYFERPEFSTKEYTAYSMGKNIRPDMVLINVKENATCQTDGPAGVDGNRPNPSLRCTRIKGDRRISYRASSANIETLDEHFDQFEKVVESLSCGWLKKTILLEDPDRKPPEPKKPIVRIYNIYEGGVVPEKTILHDGSCLDLTRVEDPWEVAFVSSNRVSLQAENNELGMSTVEDPARRKFIRISVSSKEMAAPGRPVNRRPLYMYLKPGAIPFTRPSRRYSTEHFKALLRLGPPGPVARLTYIDVKGNTECTTLGPPRRDLPNPYLYCRHWQGNLEIYYSASFAATKALRENINTAKKVINRLACNQTEGE